MNESRAAKGVSPPLAANSQSQSAVVSFEHNQPSSSSTMQVTNQPPRNNVAHLVDSLFLPNFDEAPAPASQAETDSAFFDIEHIMCAMEEGDEGQQVEDIAQSEAEVMSIVNKMVDDATMDLLNANDSSSYATDEESLDQEDAKEPTVPTVPKDKGADASTSKKVKSNTPKVLAPNNGRWKKEEHALFLEALNQYDKNWQKISSHVKTRTAVQSRTHAQKYYQKLAKVEAKGDKKTGRKGTGEVKTKVSTVGTLETKGAASGGAKKIGIVMVPKRKISEIIKPVAPKPASGLALAAEYHPPPTMHAAKTQVIPSVPPNGNTITHAIHSNITFAKAYEQAYARGYAQGAAAANAEQSNNMASFPSYVSHDSTTEYDVAVCNTQYGVPQASEGSPGEDVMGPATKRMKAEEEENRPVPPICVSSIYLPQDSA